MKITSLFVQLRRGWFGGLLVLSLAACGGGGSGGDLVGAGDGTTTLSSAALDTDINNLLALSSGERDSQARALSAKVERDWLTLSGVEAELGGAAATDAAYANVTAQLAADQLALTTPPSAPLSELIRPGQPRRILKTAFEDTAGGALFISSVEIKLLSGSLLDRTKDAKPGVSTPEDFAHGRMVSSLEKLTYDSSYEHRADDPSGLVGKLKTHFDIVACPNAQGVFTLKAKVETSMTKSGGASGQKATLDVSITGQVTDDAELAYSDVDTRMEMADFTNGKGAYVDFDLKYSIGSSSRPTSGTVNRTGGRVTDAFTNDAMAMGKVMSLVIASSLRDAAEAAWKSGRCVVMEPITDPAQRTGLQPSASVAISAAPRSRIDGGPVGGAVTATLSGEGAVTPSGTKVPADASFTYTAASTADKAGKVALEARSRRGVAKAELSFDTAEDSWIGTASYRDDIMSATAQITWLFVSSENNVSIYKSTGTGTVAYDDGTCSYPATGTDADSAAILYVDFSSTPPTYHGAGTSGIQTVTVSCKVDAGVETHVQAVAVPVFGGTKGPEGVEAAGSAVVSADGPLKIEGTDTDGAAGTFQWSFTRNR